MYIQLLRLFAVAILVLNGLPYRQIVRLHILHNFDKVGFFVNGKKMLSDNLREGGYRCYNSCDASNA